MIVKVTSREILAQPRECPDDPNPCILLIRGYFVGYPLRKVGRPKRKPECYISFAFDLHTAVVDASQRQTSAADRHKVLEILVDQCEIASDKNTNRQPMST